MLSCKMKRYLSEIHMISVWNTSFYFFNAYMSCDTSELQLHTPTFLWNSSLGFSFARSVETTISTEITDRILTPS